MQHPPLPGRRIRRRTPVQRWPHDIFSEEFETFLLGDPRIRKDFMKYHADLLEPEFCQQKQKNIKAGVFEDIFPYTASIRFLWHD